MSTNTTKSIEHRGFIDHFTDHSIIVKIISESACVACHAKGACSVGELQEKEIEISGTSGGFTTGELVNVIMEQSQGFKALLIGYIYPFIMLFTGLLTANAAGFRELNSGLFALSLLPFYYFTVYLLRNKIRRDFNFSIRKID